MGHHPRISERINALVVWLAAILITLLLGLLTQNQGEIRVDGMNFRRLDLIQYRARIGTVMQVDPGRCVKPG